MKEKFLKIVRGGVLAVGGAAIAYFVNSGFLAPEFATAIGGILLNALNQYFGDPLKAATGGG